ncbi:MAG: MFS transporter [Promethearchaeia archaeon]
MSEEKQKSQDVLTNEEIYSTKKRAFFGLGAIPDQLTYQAFTLLVFSYYFAVVGLNVLLVTAAYVVWGVWNAVNDPLLGSLSDRTKYRKGFGKRKLYLIISGIPLSIIMILLFSVPITSELIEFIYFIIIILTFELIYTMWSVNLNAIFPEMFPNEQERAKTNIFVKGFTLVAVICATAIPTLIISPLVPEGDPSLNTRLEFQGKYILTGIVLGVIILISAIIFITKGVEEEEERAEDFEKRPKFIESLKVTLKNKTFIKFTLSNMCVWFVFTTLLSVFSLYSRWVIGIQKEGDLTNTIALLSAMIIAGISLPIHQKIGKKIGTRNGLMMTCALWIVVLSPYLFLSEGMSTGFIIVTGLQGVPLGGGLFYVDILIGDVIDQDQVEYGMKRSASYYGVNAFVHRFSQIFAILAIGLVFQGTGWSDYVPATDQVVLGLKAIIFLFPAIALGLAFFFLGQFSLHGEKLEEMRKELAIIQEKNNQ